MEERKLEITAELVDIKLNEYLDIDGHVYRVQLKGDENVGRMEDISPHGAILERGPKDVIYRYLKSKIQKEKSPPKRATLTFRVES